MEKHRCKLCNKNFSNGRALGGHMRSHLSSTLPLKNPQNFHFSDSSSTRTHDDDDDHHLKPGFYELRENPKKSCKVSSPVQDGESDTESTQYPTRRRKRSKRVNRSKWAVGPGPESPTESTQVSSVSDSARSQDEEVALCLMMLSRDAWIATESTTTEVKKQPMTARVAKFKCVGCKKVFRTSRALEGHKASNKQCCLEKSNEIMSHHHHHKIFECPFCYKVFGSGQALGGHKRSHLISLGSTTAATNNNNNNNNVDSNLTTTNNNTNSCSIGDHSSVCFVLDLNFPPPIEVDDVFVA